jgi:hypothetical protein
MLILRTIQYTQIDCVDKMKFLNVKADVTYVTLLWKVKTAVFRDMTPYGLVVSVRKVQYVMSKQNREFRNGVQSVYSPASTLFTIYAKVFSVWLTSIILMMAAARSSETLVTIYRSTWYHIPENLSFNRSKIFIVSKLLHELEQNFPLYKSGCYLITRKFLTNIRMRMEVVLWNRWQITLTAKTVN